jgi:hypothetical protein
MTGETDLAKLLKNMKPERHPGEFVFCVVNTLEQATELNPICTFQENEGVTVILPKRLADECVLFYSVVCAWITLTVHSSLEAVGLTAAVSKALTEAGISCNVVAAFHHDHLFIPVKDAELAIDVLLSLTRV